MVSGKTVEKQWPPGRALLQQSFVDEHKRQRCARALAQAAHEVGLKSATVAEVTRRAKISRATFYALFENQDDALRYADGLGRRLLKEAIGATVAEPPPCKARVEAAMAILLQTACDEPHLTELCLSGPSDEELVAVLAALLGDGGAGNNRGHPGPSTEELLARGILAVVLDRLRDEDLDGLATLGASLTEVATLFRNGSRRPGAKTAE